MLKSTGVNNKLKEVITGLGKFYDVLLQNNLFQGFLDTFYSLANHQRVGVMHTVIQVTSIALKEKSYTKTIQ
jgi:hypothetical protein